MINMKKFFQFSLLQWLVITISFMLASASFSSGKQAWQSVELNKKESLQIQKQITTIVNQTGGKVGIGVYSLVSHQGFYWNGDKFFPMCSTYKVAIAVRLLQLVEAGTLHLDQLITIEPQDLIPGGTGVISEQLFYPGVKISLMNLLSLMIRLSDNTATDKILSLIGGPEAVTETVRKLGIENMRIDRPTMGIVEDAYGVRSQIDAIPKNKRNLAELLKIFNSASIESQKKGMHAFETSDLDTTTPKAMVTLLESIVTNKALQPKYADLLLDVMSQTQTGETRLKGLMPKSIIVAHKTGTIQRIANDVGVLIPKDNLKNKVIVVVYVNANTKGETNSNHAIARVAQVAYQHFIEKK